MNNERSDDLTARERSAYESLAESVPPPPECEARIVEELRTRNLLRSSPVTSGDRWIPIPFWRRLLPVASRVAFAAAALAGAFIVGAEYGRRSGVVEAPVEPAEAFFEVEKSDEGEIFQSADGEMVASVRIVPLAFHPGRPLELAGHEKPPIDRNDDLAYGDYPLYPLDDSPPSVSPRVP